MTAMVIKDMKMGRSTMYRCPNQKHNKPVLAGQEPKQEHDIVHYCSAADAIAQGWRPTSDKMWVPAESGLKYVWVCPACALAYGLRRGDA